MIRAVAAFAGFILTLTGLLVTITTLTVDGWTVLAGVGVALLALDLLVEEYQHREVHS